MKKTKSGFNFDNTYLELGNQMYSELDFKNEYDSEIQIFNSVLSDTLGLDSEFLKSIDGRKLLSASVNEELGKGFSQAYSGHQFGHFSNLGDGRAIMLGEHITKSKERFDIQLKGSGITPFSRRGDGKATLSSMLREYIISESMHQLSIPTTRSLAVLKTNESVRREVMHDGAILVRVAKSHIRVGTFEYAYANAKYDTVKELADYAINRHYSNLLNEKDTYYKFLIKVINKQASLIAKWQSVGFIHGVMNTDNVLISGETIDYGPCAFMNEYHPKTVFSSIDSNGRYCYMNQPYIGSWNLARFAETLLPILHENKEKAVTLANKALAEYERRYNEYWLKRMALKIGIKEVMSDDKALIDELLNIMELKSLDFTNTFRSLSKREYLSYNIIEQSEFLGWVKKWKRRLDKQGINLKDAEDIMKQYNPNIIPRNHIIEKVLSKASNEEDFDLFNEFLGLMKETFNYDLEISDEYLKPLKSNKKHVTYCGT